jgi:hypothetical protein
MTKFLSKEHTILERPYMDFRPFGVDEHEQLIRDISGVFIARASVIWRSMSPPRRLIHRRAHAQLRNSAAFSMNA